MAIDHAILIWYLVFFTLLDDHTLNYHSPSSQYSCTSNSLPVATVPITSTSLLLCYMCSVDKLLTMFGNCLIRKAPLWRIPFWGLLPPPNQGHGKQLPPPQTVIVFMSEQCSLPTCATEIKDRHHQLSPAQKWITITRREWQSESSEREGGRERTSRLWLWVDGERQGEAIICKFNRQSRCEGRDTMSDTVTWRRVGGGRPRLQTTTDVERGNQSTNTYTHTPAHMNDHQTSAPTWKWMR